MSAPESNQQFDNYSKEFQLRIELLRAAGQWSKDMVDARLTDAKMLDQRERTKTTEHINGSLKRALREIENAEREAERDRASLERRLVHLPRIVSGVKPVDLTTFYARWESLLWMLGQAEIGNEFAAIAPKHREPTNFVSLGQSGNVPAVPGSVENAMQLAYFMHGKLLYFQPGSEVHQLFAGIVHQLDEAKAKAVADLQAQLDAARKGTYEKLHELKAFLGLKEGGE